MQLKEKVMKSLFSLLLFVLSGAALMVSGQEAPAVNRMRIVGDIASSSERVVKGAPFSAEAVSESVQLLGDGNRIVRNSTSKLYRAGDGRYRREGAANSGSGFGAYFELNPGIMILDPVGGFRYNLNPLSKTAHQMVLKSPGSSTSGGGFQVARAVNSDKTRTEHVIIKGGAATLTPEEKAELDKLATSYTAISKTYPSSNVPYAGFPAMGHDAKTEQLGMQNIEGVEAEGIRTTTTIAAGAIGNERPIEIVYEKWYSKDLQLVVMSKHSDPRYGEQTYRLTNINRSEPDASLFILPSEYKLQTGPGSFYKFSTPGGEGNVFTVCKPAAAAAPVKKTRP